MRSGTCHIVGAGAFCARGLHPKTGDLLLAADGGLRALQALGLRPHLLLGDMDSLRAPARGIPTLRFPRHKDDTDMALAVKLALSRGFRRFALYGAAGGRQDHFQANLQLMAGLAARRCQVRLVARDFTVHAVCNGTLTLPGLARGQTVSVFCAGSHASGVTLRGLRYEISDARLRGDDPLGVSNRAAGGSAVIAVRSGTLLVFAMRQRAV